MFTEKQLIKKGFEFNSDGVKKPSEWLYTQTRGVYYPSMLRTTYHAQRGANNIRSAQLIDDEYLEIHYDIVAFINENVDEYGTVASCAEFTFGRGGLYDLAKIMTDEFTALYKGSSWGDGIDYNDTIEEFLCDRRWPEQYQPFAPSTRLIPN